MKRAASRLAEWPESTFVLQQAGAAVISIEDVRGDERSSKIWPPRARAGGHRRRQRRAPVLERRPAPLPPARMEEVDPTGAGDIFAAAFFIRLQATRDPWEAARFATNLASYSVMRPGWKAFPTEEEVQSLYDRKISSSNYNKERGAMARIYTRSSIKKVALEKPHGH
jgi:sugar/nucleoside kinase (ribokinase family)